MSRRREPPNCSAGRTWLRARLEREGDKLGLGALTGQDSRALDVFSHALFLFAVSDANGRGAALMALFAAVRAMQPSVREFAKKLIPFALDWSDEDTLWSQIATFDPHRLVPS